MLKQQGLTGFGIVSSFLHRRVQPLKERMVPALELTDEEVLERLQKMLKGASVVPLTVSEFSTNNSPPAVSCLSLCPGTLCTLVVSTFV